MNKMENYRPCAAAKPATAKLLLLILREITDDRDTITIPQRRIAEAIGMSKSAVGRNLRRLERAGLIGIQATYNECNGRMPNKYTLRRENNRDPSLFVFVLIGAGSVSLPGSVPVLWSGFPNSVPRAPNSIQVYDTGRAQVGEASFISSMNFLPTWSAPAKAHSPWSVRFPIRSRCRCQRAGHSIRSRRVGKSRLAISLW